MKNECLAHYPLETVQSFLHSGIITEDQWEGYAHAWRTSVPRMSNELAAIMDRVG